MDATALQQRLDALTYVPNHCYEFLSMQGKNKVSAERFAYIVGHLKGLVEGREVLDVGCNKGFVSLWCAENGARRVVAEDIRQEYTELVGDLAQCKGLGNVTVTVKPLWKLGEVHEVEGVPVTKEGDLALVLGVAHHLTLDHGLDWLWRLYYLGYDVLMEFPCVGSDQTVEFLRGKVPEAKRQLLREDLLREKVEGLYDVELVGRSPDLGRSLYHLRKGELPTSSVGHVREGSLVAKGRKTEVYLVGADGAAVLKGWHGRQRDAKGYALRWVRAQQILAKQFPNVVARVRGLVVGEAGAVEGLVEDYKGGQGFEQIGARALFDAQLFLLSLNLIALDFHLSSVFGGSVLDHELIEVRTRGTEEFFRRKVSRTWEQTNLDGIRVGGYDDGPAMLRVNEQAAREFRSLVASGAALEGVLRQARGFQWFRQEQRAGVRQGG